MRRLGVETRMPPHEVWKSFDLARWFHHADTGYLGGDLCQPERDRQDQISFGDGEDRGQKERKTKRDTPLYATMVC